jgi:site-specific DNA-cytosine methylase
MTLKPLILSLCDHSGTWSQPYADSGYEVIRVDLQDGKDVRLFEHPGRPVRGILAAPPCDHFALSGARWWEGKGESAVFEGLAVVDACLRIVAATRPDWWALENPVGRLRRWLGPPAWSFDPCDFGDPYTKRTLLWGNFTPPMPLYSAAARNVVEPTMGSMMHTAVRDKAKRSVTPAGFARAFFESNP